MKALSAGGCSVILNSVDARDVVSAAVKECRSMGAPKVEHHGADMARPEEIKDLFTFISDKCGRTPDILVNNAGLNFFFCCFSLF